MERGIDGSGLCVEAEGEGGKSGSDEIAKAMDGDGSLGDSGDESSMKNPEWLSIQSSSSSGSSEGGSSVA